MSGASPWGAQGVPPQHPDQRGRGEARIPLELPPATPVGAVWGHLADRLGAGAPPDGLRYALNHAWTLPGAALRDGDEVALVLPVSGG